MNTAANKLKLATVEIHSMIDIITNSSTEIFCVVEGKSEEAIQKILRNLMKDLDCDLCGDSDYGLTVSEHNDYDEHYKEIPRPGQFDIYYEHGHHPCKLIRQKIEEVFKVVKFKD